MSRGDIRIRVVGTSVNWAACVGVTRFLCHLAACLVWSRHLRPSAPEPWSADRSAACPHLLPEMCHGCIAAAGHFETLLLEGNLSTLL